MLPINSYEAYANVNAYNSLKSPLVSAQDAAVDTGFNSHLSDQEQKEQQLSYNAYKSAINSSEPTNFVMEEEVSTSEALAEIYSQAAYRDSAITVVSLAQNKPGDQVNLAI